MTDDNYFKSKHYIKLRQEELEYELYITYYEERQQEFFIEELPHKKYKREQHYGKNK